MGSKIIPQNMHSQSVWPEHFNRPFWSHSDECPYLPESLSLPWTHASSLLDDACLQGSFRRVRWLLCLLARQTWGSID